MISEPIREFYLGLFASVSLFQFIGFIFMLNNFPEIFMAHTILTWILGFIQAHLFIIFRQVGIEIQKERNSK